MPAERLKVAVLVSGGVDSSVALRLLHAAGHSVTAFYLKIWFQEDFENFWPACPWDEDLWYATAVCEEEDEVCSLATLMDLPNKDWKDSQGLCFLGKVKFSEFAAKHIGEMEGILLKAETGDYLGNRKGFWFYTIGQRQSLGLPGGPWYVVEKDVHNNVIFVSRHYYSFDKRRCTFRVGSPKWISGSPPKNTQLRFKLWRGCDCTFIRRRSGLSSRSVCSFLYDGEVSIGSGVILDSRDDKSFPICNKALEIAQLKDKSKLGKPVRIMNL